MKIGRTPSKTRREGGFVLSLSLAVIALLSTILAVSLQSVSGARLFANEERAAQLKLLSKITASLRSPGAISVFSYRSSQAIPIEEFTLVRCDRLSSSVPRSRFVAQSNCTEHELQHIENRLVLRGNLVVSTPIEFTESRIVVVMGTLLSTGSITVRGDITLVAIGDISLSAVETDPAGRLRVISARGRVSIQHSRGRPPEILTLPDHPVVPGTTPLLSRPFNTLLGLS